jgi:hypothetical protein
MENFLSWISKPVEDDEVEIWFNRHNMTIEKRQLYADFCNSLVDLIQKTYLGGDDTLNTKTDIQLTDEDKRNHFSWCWEKTIDNFLKENIRYKTKGEHKEYFEEFFTEVYYNQKEKIVKNSLVKFFDSLFDESNYFTQSDLDMIKEIYKLMEKNKVQN